MSITTAITITKKLEAILEVLDDELLSPAAFFELSAEAHVMLSRLSHMLPRPVPLPEIKD